MKVQRPLTSAKQSHIPPVERAALWTAAFASAGLFIAMAAMSALRLWGAGLFSLLFLSPYLLAFGWLISLLAFRASIRAHHSLAIATAILAVVTAFAYVPEWKNSGGCMSGLILFGSIPLLIGLPIVFAVCWLLQGLKRHD